MRVLLLGLAALLFAISLTPASAWGVKGHGWTCQNAVKLLPEGELRDSMQKDVIAIMTACLMPDFQLKDGANEELEAPNHYIDLDAVTPLPGPGDLPRTRLEAARYFARNGLTLRDGGLLPWRIEEIYGDLVNAFATKSPKTAYFAGLLAHYAADSTQPLHATKDYNGRTDPATGERALRGIHGDYEITFIEDSGLEFRKSSLAMAQPPSRIADVFAAAVDMAFDSLNHVDRIYEVAGRYNGEGRYADWDREMGEMTRDRLAKADTFTASLWLSAWLEAQEIIATREASPR
jgi:hypothetical protein